MTGSQLCKKTPSLLAINGQLCDSVEEQAESFDSPLARF